MIRKAPKKVAVKKRTAKKVSESVVRLENIGLRNEIEELKKRIAAPAPLDITIHDPEPKDQKARRVYVGEVARLHHDILRPKLLTMIHASHVLLESSDNRPEQDQAIKGTIYALREIIRWGDLLSNEHIANSQSEEEEEK